MTQDQAKVEHSLNPSPRLTALLGVFDFLLKPWGGPLLGLVGWAATAPFSTSAFAMALCWWGVTLLVWSIQAERKWINVLPFPPLTVIALHLFLRWELGGMLLLLSDERSGAYTNWTNNIARALQVNALFTTLLIGIPLIVDLKLLRRQTSPSAVFKICPSSKSTLGKWVLLTVITGIVAIGYALIGYYSGTLDRGAEYLRWAGRFWRPDTFFSATIRLRDIYFVVLPWTIYVLRKRPAVLFAFLAPTIFSTCITSLLGGRGTLLYPVILTVGGVWLAGIKPRVIRVIILSTLAFSIAFIPFAATFRTFNSTSVDKSDLFGKIRLARQSNSLSNLSLANLGREIYASSDPFLFVAPGVDQEPAGFKRFSNLRYIWLPRVFGEKRPEINDGHLVANEILGTPEANMHEGRYVSFPSITTGGDLYWRFRWEGVIVGGALLGILYSLACRFWYTYADLSKNTYTILLALFPSTFLQGPPLRSVLETAWNWLYEIPKYCLLLLAVAAIIEMGMNIISKQRSQI